MSHLIETVAPSSAPSPDDTALTLAGFVATFEASPCTETTAALHLVAAFSKDEDLRTHISGVLATRRQPLPSWLAHLDDAHVDGDVLLVTDPLGDRSAYIFAVRMAGGVRFTVIVVVDHTVADAVREAMIVLDSPDAVALLSREEIRRASRIGGETVVTQPDPADARAVIEYAISQGARVFPPFESQTWPGNRAFVEWAVGLLPPGGVAPAPPSWSDDDLRQIGDAFFASTDGVGFQSSVFKRLLDLTVRFAVASGVTDPLRWTPLTVRALLDWVLGTRLVDRYFAALLTDLLITWVPYTCRLRGVDPQFTEQVRGAVERLADEFINAVDDRLTREEEEEDDDDDDPVLAAGG